MADYRFPDHPMSPPGARQAPDERQAPPPPANPWLASLGGDRLARVRETRRVLGISESPPDPVAHRVKQRDAIALHAIEQARHRAVLQGAESWRSAWSGYGEQLREFNERTEAERQRVENERRAAADKKVAADEARRNRQHDAIVANADETSATIAAIRGEISAILGA